MFGVQSGSFWNLSFRVPCSLILYSDSAVRSSCIFSHSSTIDISCINLMFFFFRSALKGYILMSPASCVSRGGRAGGGARDHLHGVVELCRGAPGSARPALPALTPVAGRLLQPEVEAPVSAAGTRGARTQPEAIRAPPPACAPLDGNGV